MINLLAAAFLWIVSHLGISSTKLRTILINLLGKRVFLVVYSLIAVATLSYLVVSYNHLGSSAYLWSPIPMLRWLALLLMPAACVFLVGAFMTVNPSIVGQGYKLARIGEGSGIIRITRHPFQWAVIIWAVLHILSKGTLGSLIFFGAFGFVSLVGTVLMDRKKSMKIGHDWQQFSNVTSNIPFMAIIQRRNQLRLDEIWFPAIIGLSVYALFLYWHQSISGVALL